MSDPELNRLTATPHRRGPRSGRGRRLLILAAAALLIVFELLGVTLSLGARSYDT